MRRLGSDNDGDVALKFTADEEGVFSSCMLRCRLGDGDGGAERIEVEDVEASTSN